MRHKLFVDSLPQPSQADVRDGIVVSSSAGQIDVRPSGSNIVFRNVEVVGDIPRPGDTVRIHNIRGRRVAFTSTMGDESAGGSAGSVTNNYSTVIEGQSLANLLAQSTFRGELVSDDTLAKFSPDGYLSGATLAAGLGDTDSDPDRDTWFSSSAVILRGGPRSLISFASNTEGSSGIRGSASAIEIGTDTGFGEPTVLLPGGSSVLSDTGYIGGAAVPSAPLHGAGTMEQLRLEHSKSARSASFRVKENGDLSIGADGGHIEFRGEVNAQDVDADSITTFRLRAYSLIAEHDASFNGDLIVAVGAAQVAEDFLLPTAGLSTSIKVYKDMGYSGRKFDDNDIVGIRQLQRTGTKTANLLTAWGTVTYVRDDDSQDPPIQEYVFTRSMSPKAGPASGMIVRGSPVINFGQTSGGYIQVRSWNASGAIPRIETLSWTTHPYNPTTQAVFGNLAGVGGSNKFGVWIKTLSTTGGIDVIGGDLKFTTNKITGDDGAGRTFELGSTRVYGQDESVLHTLKWYEIDNDSIILGASYDDGIGTLYDDWLTISRTLDPQGAGVSDVLFEHNAISGVGFSNLVIRTKSQTQTVALSMVASQTSATAVFELDSFTIGGKLITHQSEASGAGIVAPHGTAPSSPVDGDIWTTTAGLYVRVNGSTVGPLAGTIDGSGTTNYLPRFSDSNTLTDSGITDDGSLLSALRRMTFATATTGSASLTLPHGAAPSSPNNGDMWTTTGGLYVRVNGGTVGPLGTGGAASPLVSIFTVDGSLHNVDLCPQRIYNIWGATRTISEVAISVGVAPTGQAIIVDVLKNGTTLFTNQANRPQIAASAYSGTSTTIDVSSWADDDYLQVQVEQVGSITAGAYLVVEVKHG